MCVRPAGSEIKKNARYSVLWVPFLGRTFDLQIGYDAKKIANYRPIDLLSNISKVIILLGMNNGIVILYRH